MAKVLVTGAGGFIGGHLCKYLADKGHEVYGTDIRFPSFRIPEDIGIQRFFLRDLRDNAQAHDIFEYLKPEWVFHLAADMGGMGHISNNHAAIMTNNLQIDVNTILAARGIGVEKFFYSSSVCVYPEFLQTDTMHISNMVEEHAYPAEPMDAYGWEKLTTENLLEHYWHDYGMPVYIARFHNCYGPYGTWQGGREKAPAALCRKFAEAKHFQEPPYEIEIWGNGEQMRPFVYVEDLVDGIYRLVQTNCHEPVNLGPTWSKESRGKHIVTINELARKIASAAGINYQPAYIPGPEGVRWRGADGTMMRKLTGWEPTTSLSEGISKTYAWIEQQVIDNYTKASDYAYDAQR